MRYLIVLLLAGCATEPAVQLRTPAEIECGKQATEFVKPRYPDAEYDERGAPKYSLFSDAWQSYAIVLNRCLERSGAY